VRELYVLDHLAIFLCKLERGALIGVGQDDGELFPTVAGGEVGRAPCEFLQPAAERLQAIVARLVAVRVVEALEMIDVDQQQGERLPLASTARVFLGQRIVEGAAVVQAGLWQATPPSRRITPSVLKWGWLAARRRT
jgi:hypothetical protein